MKSLLDVAGDAGDGMTVASKKVRGLTMAKKEKVIEGLVDDAGERRESQ